jgi:hypothetical protein
VDSSWWDSDSGCTMIAARPAEAPELWRSYVHGAHRSYTHQGVECALDLDQLRSGADTALFFVALDNEGSMRGGLRVRKPYCHAEESHAILEWAGHPDLEVVAAMITQRIPDGVVEAKSAWVCPQPGPRRGLARSLARTALPILDLLDVRYVMATAADHVLKAWSSSGGRIAAHIAPTAYPDHRYATRMMWWDRTTILTDAEPAQATKMLTYLNTIHRNHLSHSQCQLEVAPA